MVGYDLKKVINFSVRHEEMFVIPPPGETLNDEPFINSFIYLSLL